METHTGRFRVYRVVEPVGEVAVQPRDPLPGGSFVPSGLTGLVPMEARLDRLPSVGEPATDALFVDPDADSYSISTQRRTADRNTTPTASNSHRDDDGDGDETEHPEHECQDADEAAAESQWRFVQRCG